MHWKLNSKSRAQRLISLSLVLACVLGYGTLPSLGQNRSNGKIGGGVPNPPTKTYADQSAVINFRQLAREEARRAEDKPGQILMKRGQAAPEPRPMPGTRNLPPGIHLPPGLKVPAASGEALDAAQSATINAQAEASPTLPSPPPAPDFLALLDDQTFIPPDTDGAVGPNYVATALNSDIRLQARDGSEIVTLPTQNFWSFLGPGETFDPHVLYDPYAERWVFTEVSDSGAPTSSVLLAVSQTSDPTGAWNLYRVLADSSAFSFADFPTIGFNKDWIAVSVNMFSDFGAGFLESRIFVFDKADVYGGGAGLYTLIQHPGFAVQPARTYDKNLQGLFLVEDYSGNADGNFGFGVLRVSGIVGSGKLNTPTLYPAVAFVAGPAWSDEPPVSNFEPQENETMGEGIDGGDARLEQVIYRNSRLWTSHAVYLPADAPTRSAAQWWQINPFNDQQGFVQVQQFGRVDDPSNTVDYAYPSIAVNASNDALMGYSRFSSTQFASGDYSFRYHADPLSTMRGDNVLKPGEAFYFKNYGAARNRWGDFSATVVDPANDLDMWTIQEYAATPGVVFDPLVGLFLQDRWGTWWGRVQVKGQNFTPPRK